MRTTIEIMDELFLGRDAALEKFAKVRHAKYEVELWRKGMPYASLGKRSKSYFEKEYLGGIKIYDASDEQIAEGLKRLSFAVGMGLKNPTGCYERTLRLVNELNAAIVREGLGVSVDVERFIDYFTFSHNEAVLYRPEMIEAYPYFFDDDHRKEYKASIRFLKEMKRKMHPGVINNMVKEVKKASVPV